jgi:hypothetical protein
MSNRHISINGGNYNEVVQGNVVNVSGGTYIQGDLVDTSQVVLNIQERLDSALAEGYPIEVAQSRVAHELVTQSKPTADMVKTLKYVSNAATSGVIGEATVLVAKLALGMMGINLG